MQSGSATRPFTAFALFDCLVRFVFASGCRTNKNALHPFKCKGRRALYIALVVPPSFADISRHQPLQVLTYFSPMTGASGRVLLSHEAISSRSFGVFFTVGQHMGFPPTAHSLDATATVTRPFTAFALFGCCVSQFITYICVGCQGF